MIEMQFLLEFRISKETGGGLPGGNRETPREATKKRTKREPRGNQEGTKRKARGKPKESQRTAKGKPKPPCASTPPLS